MSDNPLNSRREFLQRLIALTALAGVTPFTDAFGKPFGDILNGKLPVRPLGKTGHLVSIYSLGGQGSIEVPGREEISVEIINRAIDLGINYIDTAAAYGRQTPSVARADAMGTSERNIGEVMKFRRKEVFLTSKTHDRTYDGSMRLLEKSLKQLNTDHLDLWQIHNVKLAEIETLDSITGDDGVLKAMIKARDEKMIRFIGFTGHEGPDVLNALLERFPFDNVLVAINAADKHHDPFIEKFLPNAVKREMGIVGMKIPARDRIFSNGGIITMKEAMDYVLTLPVSTIIVGLDKIAELEENIKIAREFSPLTADEMLAIEAKTKPHYKDLMFFKNLSEWPAEW
jgi:aryl-alcohol dehydrogenase-like predicted oxidoreductase